MSQAAFEIAAKSYVGNDGKITFGEIPKLSPQQQIVSRGAAHVAVNNAAHELGLTIQTGIAIEAAL